MKILPTKFPRYTVSDTGVVFRDGKPLKSHDRGNAVKKNPSRYQAVNISIYDDNGKFAKQIKYYVHRLVAEAFIENPNNLSDIDHIDENKENNHVSNLRWYTRKQNMERNGLPEGTRRKRGKGRGKGKEYGSTYEKKDGKWVLVPNPNRGTPWNKGLKGSSWNTLPDGTVRTRKVNGKTGTFIKENGKWVYQKKPKEPKVYQRKEKDPDGTIKQRSNGYYYIRRDGEWCYLRKKDYAKYGINPK